MLLETPQIAAEFANTVSFGETPKQYTPHQRCHTKRQLQQRFRFMFDVPIASTRWTKPQNESLKVAVFIPVEGDIERDFPHQVANKQHRTKVERSPIGVIRVNYASEGNNVSLSFATFWRNSLHFFLFMINVDLSPPKYFLLTHQSEGLPDSIWC